MKTVSRIVSMSAAFSLLLVVIAVQPARAESESGDVPSMSGSSEVVAEFSLTDPQDALRYSQIQKKSPQRKPAVQAKHLGEPTNLRDAAIRDLAGMDDGE